MSDTTDWDPTTAMFAHARHVATIQKAISRMEGHAFGSDMRFQSDGWRMKFPDMGWTHHVPFQREMVDDLNAAIFPVVKAYCEKLRQELANECAKLAARSLAEPQFKAHEIPKTSRETK